MVSSWRAACKAAFVGLPAMAACKSTIHLAACSSATLPGLMPQPMAHPHHASQSLTAVHFDLQLTHALPQPSTHGHACREPPPDAEPDRDPKAEHYAL